MPYKTPIVCLKCEATESPLWTNAENLGVVCLNCVTEAKKDIDEDVEIKDEDEEKQPKKKARTTRSYKTRQNPNTGTKSNTKGRGRRSLFKKVPMKAPASVSTTVTSNSVFYKGSYIQVGDIIAVRDEDNDSYYAQITGLMTDQYCNKSAVLQWLLPTKESPPPNEEFDPASYIVGPEEDFPRSLDCMEFIMHAPSDYYKARSTPYSTVLENAKSGFIWSSIDSVKR